MKSITTATAFVICVMSASPSWAKIRLTEGEMDKVTGGLYINAGNFTYDFVTVAANLNNYNAYNGYNILGGPDYPGILYVEPLPGWLLH